MDLVTEAQISLEIIVNESTRRSEMSWEEFRSEGADWVTVGDGNSHGEDELDQLSYIGIGRPKYQKFVGG